MFLKLPSPDRRRFRPSPVSLSVDVMEAIASDVFESRAQRKVPAWVAGLARTGWAVWKFVAGTLLAMTPGGGAHRRGMDEPVHAAHRLQGVVEADRTPVQETDDLSRGGSAHARMDRPRVMAELGAEPDACGRPEAGADSSLGARALEQPEDRLPVDPQHGARPLLPSLLMAVWWYAGWQVSFNKAYEYFANGALFSLTGGLLLIVVMFYVPMAQARQAVAGEARRFWQFGLVRRVIRRRWLLCTLLALGYAAAGAVVMILISIPMSPGSAGLFQLTSRRQTQAEPPRLLPERGTVHLPGLCHASLVRRQDLCLGHWTYVVDRRSSRGRTRAGRTPCLSAELINSPAAAAEWTRRDAIVSWTLSAPFRATCGAIVFAAWAALRRGSLYQPVLHLPRAARLAEPPAHPTPMGRLHSAGAAGASVRFEFEV